MRIVLDTNTILSGLLWHGNEEKLLKEIDRGRVQMYLSEEIFDEVTNVLRRKKLQDILSKANLSEDELIEQITRKGNFIKPKTKINVITEDSEDNKILECAVEAKAKYIVSGDKHLLKLKKFKGIKIVKSKEILEILKKKN